MVRPTSEQERAVELFRTGASLAIHAFAGAGKTSTLALMAAATGRPGVYLAFNRAIAHEARRRFPARVASHTLHGYAFGQVRARFGNRAEKLTGQVNPNRVVELLELGPLQVSRRVVLGPRMVGSLVRATVSRFCRSDAPAPVREHVPRWGSLADLSWWDFRRCADRIARDAARLWERMGDPASDVPLGHDGYLKFWALANPVLPGEFVLLDEAQDSNALTVGLVQRLGAQLVVVGDEYQQIYEWRGAVNAMGRLRTRHRTHLTLSFRFGPVIAAAATRVLKVLGERRTLQGLPGLPGRLSCPSPEVMLCRGNATLLGCAMDAVARGRRVAVVGGVAGLQGELEDVERLQQGIPARHPAFFGYRGWREVLRAADREEEVDLQGTVRMVRTYGVAELRRCLDTVVAREEDAELVLSTAHKAKGREWRRVALADDYAPWRRRGRGRERLHREEARLLYVAITRAREELDIPWGLRRKLGIRG